MQTIEDHLLQVPSNIKLLNWDEKIEFLYQQQFSTWEMAKNHYNHLKTIEKKTIMVEDFVFEVFFNEARARSTCADLSKKAIEKRPCFLCPNKLYTEERGYSILNKYLILINPFPIYTRHLTISDFKHVPQQIENRIIDMLEIAKSLSGFTIFYNGPRCGASAPDHFHFQAAQKGNMPIDWEIDQLKHKQSTLFEKDQIRIFEMNNYLRKTIVFESEDKEPIDYFFNQTMKQLPFDEDSNEVKMNLMASFTNNKYRLILFPRGQQRPACFYKEGDDKLMVSPASVEFGGSFVTPREIDFKKINADHMHQIFQEVSYTDVKLTY